MIAPGQINHVAWNLWQITCVAECCNYRLQTLTFQSAKTQKTFRCRTACEAKVYSPVMSLCTGHDGVIGSPFLDGFP